MDTGIEQIFKKVDNRLRMDRTILGIIGLVVLFIGAVAGSAATASGWIGGSSSGGSKVPIYVSADPKVNAQVSMNGGFSAIAKAVLPAVVTITVESRVRQQQTVPFFFDPFRDFFDRPDQDDEGTPTPRRRTTPRNQAPGRLRQTGLGSGVIVSPDGYILTNNHVVEEADRVKVELADRRILEAKVVGKDAPSDLAIIKIQSTDLPSLQFGDSDKVEVGDLVLAIGNPLGIGPSVTMGIISAKGRQAKFTSGNAYEDFLQTDAAINHGNSGGALVNLHGELVGIPSQIYSQTGGNIGIGFAIPTKMARNVMDQLIRGGKVHRGLLGLRGDDVSPELARQFGYKGVDGAIVHDVEKGDPADLAGVKPGDIIMEFNGQHIINYSQLRNVASSTPPGTTIKLKVWRDGAEHTLSVKLAEFDSSLTADANEKPGSSIPTSTTGGVLTGVRVENIPPEISRNLDGIRGVVVTDVDPESKASDKLQRGDIIESVNRQPVTNINEYNAAMQKAGKKEVLLRVYRNKTWQFIVVNGED
ncbi:MAG: Do family serine endopeptidase [Blastocatellia bacterium]|nr:Do family serine endopeptidase [Blastocatellia bacterium]